MLSLAITVARATRYVFSAPDTNALWTIRVRGRVVGLLVSEAGVRRLSWFAGTDPRLIHYAGPLDGDVEALAGALGTRLGTPVELETLPG